MHIRYPQPLSDPAETGRGKGLLVLAIVETTLTTLLSLGWMALALAMSMEAYDREPGDPGRPSGQGGLALLALGVLVSVGVTWLLRTVRRPGVRPGVSGAVALRLLAVLTLTGFLLADLLDG
ncbi:hypothetical protein BU197_14520 [Streptomyces sp. CBMA291]|nr:hypothetical protein [Streptomyces sp. CBMA291]MBD0715285.1 hypothetical protein [Streptomyces sp. CBMA370]MBD0717873.1 hypothetical protein [Streptomyces sp. CBMA370]